MQSSDFQTIASLIAAAPEGAVVRGVIYIDGERVQVQFKLINGTVVAVLPSGQVVNLGDVELADGAESPVYVESAPISESGRSVPTVQSSSSQLGSVGGGSISLLDEGELTQQVDVGSTPLITSTEETSSDSENTDSDEEPIAPESSVGDILGSITAITGVVAEGETLAAGVISDSNGGVTDITYQWKADGINISGATASTYTLTMAEVGALITVVATYTDNEGSGKQVISAASAVVIDSTQPMVIGAVNPASAELVKLGENVSVELTFNENVILANTKHATITLLIDRASGGIESVTATAIGDGTSSNKLLFTTTSLPAGLDDTDGVQVQANSLVYSGTDLQDVSGNSASTSFAAITTLSNEQVYTVQPATPSIHSVYTSSSSAVLGDKGSSSGLDVGLTNDTTPTVRIGLITTGASAAVAGDTVELFSGANSLGSKLLTSSDISNGYVDITSTPLAAGDYTFSATVTNSQNITSSLSTESALQWAQSAVASSEYNNSTFSAAQAAGAPDSPLNLGGAEADSQNSWAEATASRGQVQTLELTYAAAVNIKQIVVRETFNPGTISKIEFWDASLNSGAGGWSTTEVYTRDLTTGAETGGLISGLDSKQVGSNTYTKVSDTTITLEAPTSFTSNKIRLYVGDSVVEFNEIDAVRLVGAGNHTITVDDSVEAVDLDPDTVGIQTSSNVTFNRAALAGGVKFDDSVQTPSAIDIAQIKVILSGANLDTTNDKLLLDTEVSLGSDLAKVDSKTIGSVGGLSYVYTSSDKTLLISKSDETAFTASEVEGVVESIRLKNVQADSLEGDRTATFSYIDKAGNQSASATATLTMDSNYTVATPVLSINDTGFNNSDKITQDATLTIDNLIVDGNWEYKVDGGRWIGATGNSVTLKPSDLFTDTALFSQTGAGNFGILAASGNYTTNTTTDTIYLDFTTSNIASSANEVLFEASGGYGTVIYRKGTDLYVAVGNGLAGSTTQAGDLIVNGVLADSQRYQLVVEMTGEQGIKAYLAGNQDGLPMNYTLIGTSTTGLWEDGALAGWAAQADGGALGQVNDSIHPADVTYSSFTGTIHEGKIYDDQSLSQIWTARTVDTVDLTVRQYDSRGNVSVDQSLTGFQLDIAKPVLDLDTDAVGSGYAISVNYATVATGVSLDDNANVAVITETGSDIASIKVTVSGVLDAGEEKITLDVDQALNGDFNASNVTVGGMLKKIRAKK
jgi:hypothetical protein